MKKLEEILRKYNFPKRLKQAPTIFKEIENIAGFQLPDDYKYYLINYMEHDVFIGPQFLRLWDIDNIMEHNNGYGIIDNLPYTIGIGSNGGGEFIAIELYEKNSFRIILSPFIDLDKQYHIEIGESFTDMLTRLENNAPWFK
ncbi:SMI1/KNR4 family protein [Mucilaginibacter sp.]|uniref:SMI1/KNR4 family protein n=1 Tax=Mucilaginibacter sp. TaxID=1882438 RepID=UPI00262A282E|nr:SMI1/KNR4 family protein [Mucilaginibacter sp.]MDB4919935.1 hypothetical protein [Mucilaginibacter sp.]